MKEDDSHPATEECGVSERRTREGRTKRVYTPVIPRTGMTPLIRVSSIADLRSNLKMPDSPGKQPGRNQPPRQIPRGSASFRR